MNDRSLLTRATAAIDPRAAEAALPISGYQGTRFAGVSVSSYNAETRSVEAVLSSGATVRRYHFDEELEISADAVDLGRVHSGLVCLLDAHNQWEVGAVLGSISNVRIERGHLVGRLTFADTDRGREVEGMVARRELRGVSIGYKVSVWEIIKTDPETQRESWRAKRWELLEVSLVPVPADANAGVRSAGGVNPGTTEQEDDMLIRSNAAAAAAPAAEPRPSGTNADVLTITRFNAVDALEFVRAAQEFGVEARANELVRLNQAGDISTEAARAALLQAMAEKQRAETAPARAWGIAFPASAGSQTYDNPAFLSRAIEDALYSRMSGKEPSDQARELRGLSMVQLASELLARSGVRDVHRMSPDDVLNAAAGGGRAGGSDWLGRSTPGMSTSDFPGLLTGAGNRHLHDQFAIAESVIKVLSRERSAPDFRELSGIQLSSGGKLGKVLENGEFKNGALEERKTTFRVETFGEIIALTRQAIINDDLEAFSRLITIMSRMAAETEAGIFADLLNSNPTMPYDNVALFHATHGNLAATGGAPDVTKLSAGRLAMRTMKDLDGETPLAAAPKYILANPKHETVVEQLLVATTIPTSADDTNPFHGKLMHLIDPRIAADPWYLFADPALAPVFEHAYLDGQSGPQIRTREGWRVDGIEFRVRMDFGAGIVDHRGAYKNPGA